MSEKLSLFPLLTVRTDAIVGRQKELAKLQVARDELNQPNCPTLACYIVGEGGVGKTRFLEEIERSAKRNANELVTAVLMFDDNDVHSDLDLMERIVSSLAKDKQVAKLFKDYTQLMVRFRAQQMAGITELEDVRNKVRQAFEAAWRQLAKKWRVVVLLDTAELLQYQEDDVQREFNIALPVAASRTWLFDAVRKNLIPRTLFVIAGRPKPEQLSRDLRRLATTKRVIELKGLNDAGVLEYFDALIAKLEGDGHEEEAKRVGELKRADRRLFGHATAGLPVSLAVALHLYLNDAMGGFTELVQAAKKAMTEAQRQQARDRVREAMVHGLAHYIFGDASEPLQYLALTRRGMTAQRLAAMWQGHTHEECIEVINYLKQQTLVKPRYDGSIVLHDEVADWIEHGLFANNATRAKWIYGKLLDRYNFEFAIIQKEIEKLNELSDVVQEEADYGQRAADPINLKRRIFSPDERRVNQQMLDARRLRRKLAIQRMYYALRHDPLEGFKHYYELAEETFNVNSREFDAQLRVEFLQWRNEGQYGSDDYKYRQAAIAAGITDAFIEEDLALRWLQRQYNLDKGSKQNTVQLAEEFLNSKKLLLSEVARLTLQLYRDTAIGESAPTDVAVKQISQSFDACIKRLEELKKEGDSNNLNAFVARCALAFGYYSLGFMQRKLGEHGAAIEWYRKSVLLYRELRFEINQARSLNDRAYAMALIGDVENAERAVNDALGLRKQSGFGRLIGLSMNTKGAICIASEKVVALHWCSRALEIFLVIPDEVGEMLARRTLSEALRRDARRIPDSPRRRLQRLRQACEMSEAAVKIATRLLPPESDRRADVLDDCGCAYRDLVQCCDDTRDLKLCAGDEQQEAAERSRELLAAALEAVPGQDSFKHLEVEIEINQAFLDYYLGNRTSCRTRVDQALDKVPAELRDLDHPDHASAAQRKTVLWDQLAKANFLLMWLARDEMDDPALLDHAARALYFASRFGPSDTRVTRRARNAVYDTFKGRPASDLQHFHDAAIQLISTSESSASANALSAEVRAFLEQSFGLE